MKKPQQLLSLLLCTAFVVSCGKSLMCKMPDSSDNQPLDIKHRALSLEIDPATHSIDVIDSIWFSGSIEAFDLNRNLKLRKIKFDNKKIPLKRFELETPTTGSREHQTWLCTCRYPKAELLVIHSSGNMWQDPANMKFGHETIGGEITASVGSEGIWFSSGSALFAKFDTDKMIPHRINVELPEEFRVVTQGALLRDTVKNGTRNMTWNSDLPSETPSICGGNYNVRSEIHNGVEVSTWFFNRPPDAGPVIGIHGPVNDDDVRDVLHNMTNNYLDMYTEMLGNYPYAKFAVVESFFPAGYGMPSWTLLDGQVIRMPFIPYTSLGHELLHNYWGNGVYVDNTYGNWCEGLTVYGADYRYKLQDSPEAGKAYRKVSLKNYRSYVSDGNDLPLKDFKNRHDAATRAVGYGKSMMVFHMLNEMLGQEEFDRINSLVFTEYLGKAASWMDIIHVFEREGQLDLTRFADQWLLHPGAPTLKLSDVNWDEGILSGNVTQTSAAGLIYELDLDLAISSIDGSEIMERLFVDKGSFHFEVECPEPRQVTLDPDYNIFRILDTREIEPIISMTMADKNPLFVAPDAWMGDAEKRKVLDAFAIKLREVKSPQWIKWSEFDSNVFADRTVIFVSPESMPDGLEFIDLRRSDSGWRLAGKSGDWAESNFVLSSKSIANPQNGALMFFPTSIENLQFLGRKVPHYGKYSFLSFDNNGYIQIKENLQPGQSPLRVVFGGM
jgi:aminopeptidase N